MEKNIETTIRDYNGAVVAVHNWATSSHSDACKLCTL